MNWNRALYASALLVTLGCGQNPFPKNGVVQVAKPAPIRDVEPAFVFLVPEFLEFHEGRKGEFEIKATVPSPGLPVLTIQDLPEGASYDPVTSKLVWEPSYLAANDPNNPDRTSRTYVITLTLRSSLDNKVVKQRKAQLNVLDVARTFDVHTSGDIEMKEGESVDYKIQLSNVDFPSGPFKPMITGLPAGAVVRADRSDPTVFWIHYEPDFREVTRSHSYDWNKAIFYRKFPVDLKFNGPRMQSASRSLTVTVKDVRQKPVIQTPAKVEMGADGAFSFLVLDPNGETEADLDLPEDPPFGRIQLQDSGRRRRGNNGPAHVAATLRWDQVPAEQMGKVSNISIRACVFGGRQKNLCETAQVEVSFTGTVHSLPLFDREKWPVGQILTVKVGQKIAVEIPIRDGDSPRNPLDITIPPGNENPEAKWQKGSLEIQPTREGLRQFTVVAKSAFGLVSSETFLVRVLPASWSETLLVGKFPDSPEMTKTKSLLDAPKIAIPSMLDEGLASGRNAFVLGTEALQEKSALAEIEATLARIPAAAILSPLVEQFTGTFAEELKALGASVDYRLNAAPVPLPKLGDFALEVAAGSGLEIPSQPITLAGTLTSESVSPAIFKLTADARCEAVLVLRKRPIEALPVVLKCARANGSALVLSGFEWGDLVVQDADREVPKRWIHNLLSLTRSVF